METDTAHPIETIHDVLRMKILIDPSERTLLLAHTLQVDRSRLLSHPEQPISEKDVERFLSLLKRRQHHEPIAYILGEKEFFGHTFKVTSSTLIPRPETETLVEILLEEISRNKDENSVLLDIGTGSGNIVISVALEQSNRVAKTKDALFRYIALDRSIRALTVAKENTIKHQIDRHIQFIHSNLLSSLPKSAAQSANTIFIAANLPYLSRDRYQSCAQDVREYEPKGALLAGKDGLDAYRMLLMQIQGRKEWEYKRIFAVLEIDPEQKTAIQAIIKEQLPHTSVRFSKDLSGKLRFAILERN